jgi:hypothetical protein
MPYITKGIALLALRIIETENADIFSHNSFWLNVMDQSIRQPFRGVSDAYLQFNLESKRPTSLGRS